MANGKININGVQMARTSEGYIILWTKDINNINPTDIAQIMFTNYMIEVRTKNGDKYRVSLSPVS